jgi:hypothetical protein
MTKLDYFRVETAQGFVNYTLAQHIDWDHVVKNKDELFLEHWPDLYVWLSLNVEQKYFWVGMHSHHHPGWCLTLTIYGSQNNKWFQSAWADHVHEEA